jgi:hypothetical protein
VQCLKPLWVEILAIDLFKGRCAEAVPNSIIFLMDIIPKYESLISIWVKSFSYELVCSTISV